MEEPRFHPLRRARSITSLLQMRRNQQGNGNPTIMSILMSSSPVPWRRLEERLATHPHEAVRIDSEGRSILDRALNQQTEVFPPFAIVRAILHANPRAIWGDFSDDRNDPSNASEQRTSLRTPLYLACRRRASLETLELITKARPAIPLDAPALSILWASYTNLFGGHEIDLIRSLSSDHHRDATIFLIGCKFHLILKYLTQHRTLLTSKRQQNELLHIASSSKTCSGHLLEQITTHMYQQLPASSQLSKPDPRGDHPIHCALNTLISLQNELSQLCVYQEVIARQIQKIRYLLHEFPDSAKQRNEQGSLPFHLAIQAGIVADGPTTVAVIGDETTTISPINAEQWIAEDPDALSARDMVTGFFPFQLAALNSASAAPCLVSTSSSIVSLIYDLLRPVPKLLRSCSAEVGKYTINKSSSYLNFGSESCNDGSWIEDFPYNNNHHEMENIVTSEFIDCLDDDDLDEFCRLWTHPLLRHSCERPGSLTSWNVISAACQIWSCPIGLLQALIKLHPEKLLEESNSSLRWLPLHYAIAAASIEQERDDAEETPSHDSLQRTSDVYDKIELLLQACPKAAQIPDSQNRLPFHLAVLCGKGVKLYKLLLQYYPDAIHRRASAWRRQHRQHHSEETWPPFLLAAQSPHSSIDDVFYLLTVSPELVLQ